MLVCILVYRCVFVCVVRQYDRTHRNQISVTDGRNKSALGSLSLCVYLCVCVCVCVCVCACECVADDTHRRAWHSRKYIAVYITRGIIANYGFLLRARFMSKDSLCPQQLNGVSYENIVGGGGRGKFFCHPSRLF